MSLSFVYYSVVQMKLVQNRVVPQRCEVNKYVEHAYNNESSDDIFGSDDLLEGSPAFTYTYPPYSSDVMSKETYGGDALDPSIASAFNFSKLDYDFEFEGKNNLYPSEGFIADLPMDVESFEETFNKLQEAKWLDSQTRAVTLAVVSYNYNIKTYVLSTFVFEFNSGGGCYPSYKHYPFRVDLYAFFFFFTYR